MSFLGPIIWGLVPNELKDIGNLAAFKKAIKKWSPEKCNDIGFIKKKKKKVVAEFFPFKTDIANK